MVHDHVTLSRSIIYAGGIKRETDTYVKKVNAAMAKALLNQNIDEMNLIVQVGDASFALNDDYKNTLNELNQIYTPVLQMYVSDPKPPAITNKQLEVYTALYTGRMPLKDLLIKKRTLFSKGLTLEDKQMSLVHYLRKISKESQFPNVPRNKPNNSVPHIPNNTAKTPNKATLTSKTDKRPVRIVPTNAAPRNRPEVTDELLKSRFERLKQPNPNPGSESHITDEHLHKQLERIKQPNPTPGSDYLDHLGITGTKPNQSQKQGSGPSAQRI